MYSEDISMFFFTLFKDILRGAFSALESSTSPAFFALYFDFLFSLTLAPPDIWSLIYYLFILLEGSFVRRVVSSLISGNIFSSASERRSGT